MTSVFARRWLRIALASTVVLPALALAHPGHGAHDALAGWLHPFTGLDHVLAMFAVGLWAARLGRGAVWTLPIVFPAAMLVGAMVAMRGIALPAIEPMIAISVIALGMLVASGVRLPLMASAMLVGIFAIFHGYAHASETPASSSMIPYALGFIASTVVLHALGIAAAGWLKRFAAASQRPVRVLGSLIAAAGTGMLFVGF